MVDIAEAATRKIGPLPAWAWGAVVGGGLLVYRVATGGGSGASSPFVQPIAGGTPIDYGEGAGGGGGGGGGTTTPTPTAPSPTVGGGAPRRLRGGNLRDVGLPLVDGGASRNGGGARLPSGDTGAAVPAWGALGGNGAVVLGLTAARAAAVDAAGTVARTDWIGDAPEVPSYPIVIPGTLVPKSPPILAAQGETSIVPMLDPRAALTAVRNAVGRGRVPTTRPRSAWWYTDLRERFVIDRRRRTG